MNDERTLSKWKRRFILISLAAMTVYLAVGLLVYYLCMDWYHGMVWYGYETLYPYIHWADENRNFVIFMYILIGFAVILFYGQKRAFSFLKEVVDASQQFYQGDSGLIRLSAPLREVENQMNQAKLDLLTHERIAKEAEQRKNDLVTYLAHDLKTPITSVIGYLTLMRDEPQLSEEIRARYTGIALDKAERLENLINEFFDITRFNLSKLELTLERVHISRMLEQIASEFLPIFSEKELRWNMEIEPDVELLCDPEKLERVFDNLIRNAMNYSYMRTEINLSLKQIANTVEIVIRNHGKTIPPEKIGRIFEQFFRLDSARSSETGGTGLGLAISKEIVELHGGSIRAESEDESITFTIILPSACKKIV